MTGASLALNNHVVLVTRPQHQAGLFLQRLEAAGASTVAFPTIAIRPLDLTEAMQQKLASLNEYDLLIFVSANAVRLMDKQLQALAMEAAGIKAGVAAIGRATSRELLKRGIKVHVEAEQGFNTEALLQLPTMQATWMEKKRVLLIKGEGGRDRLQKELEQRGAKIETLELYRREKPQLDSGVSRKALSESWNCTAITVTSNESLQNLYDMLEDPGKNAMLRVPLIVPSTRCYELAEHLGFQHICVAASAHDEDMLEALRQCITENNDNEESYDERI